jgi:predicted amidohydrolase
VYKPKSRGGINLMETAPVSGDSRGMIEHSARMAHENLLFLCPLAEGKTSAYVGCDIVLDSGEVLTVPDKRVLLDSGAEQASYMSKKYFEANRGVLGRYLQEEAHPVVVGNGVSQQSEGCITVQLHFVDPQGEKHLARCTLHIFDGLPPDIIIGWEDLTGQL